METAQLQSYIFGTILNFFNVYGNLDTHIKLRL